MKLRRPRNDVEAEKTRKRLSKIESRIYVLWILGVAVGALQLKPTSFNVVGATFALEKPELIEGLLFAGCITYYFVTFYFLAQSPWPTLWLGSYRRAIWFGASRNGKTLKDLSAFALRKLKLEARIAYRISYWVGAVGTLLPLAHILVYRREPVWSALRVIFAKEL